MGDVITLEIVCEEGLGETVQQNIEGLRGVIGTWRVK
jgi:hypothetical protein